MKIYTKSGDKGQTQIYAGEMIRLPKSDAVLECYGSLDELNAHIGLLLAQHSDEIINLHRNLLLAIQQNLFQIGFAISAKSALQNDDLQQIEEAIDTMQLGLPTQTHFILPGGHEIAAQTHVCRTVARRAERNMVKLICEHPIPDICLSYLNRLSDFLFVLARAINHHHQIQETTV